MMVELENKRQKKIEEQKQKVAEAMETSVILQDLQSKYELSIELLKLNQLEPIEEEKMIKLRMAYGLNSAVWILAEKGLEK